MAAINLQSHPLQALPGLSTEQLQLLHQVGLKTTADLLQAARSPAQLEAIAVQLKIPLRYLQKWVALADLARLPSVGSDYCGLLLHSGVASVAQLAAQAPGRLHPQIRKLHTMTMRRSDLCPTPDQVVQWVQEAKLAKNVGTK
jgi:hypothetical protein